MCHTWGLGRSPAELQGGQVQGHQGVPLQVKKHSLFSRFSITDEKRELTETTDEEPPPYKVFE